MNTWYILPEYVNLRQLGHIIPRDIGIVSRYKYNNVNIISINLLHLHLFFTIIERNKEKLINGLYKLKPIGEFTSPHFMEIYWRCFFKYFLGKNGYHLVKSRACNKHGGGFLMVFERRTQI
ncbi:MAG: hypothetical protein HY756_07975 [Nitrospirae bacterium]|nr:hypothetical protein [Nitrospirota bacterium]